MALLWADGFDHYGLTETYMTDGVYATAGGGGLSTAHFATGTHSYLHSSFDANNGITGLRKVLPTNTDKMGVMLRVYFPTLPVDDDAALIVDFLSQSANRSHIAVSVDSNGALRFYRGNFYGLNGGATTLIATSDPVITAAAWHHIEIQIYKHDTDGWVRAAVNSVHEYEATGLDTSYDSTNIYSVAHHNGYYTSVAGTYQRDWYMDDLIYYDFVGSSAVETDFVPATDGSGKATNYITELECLYRYPDGNTAEDDWAKSTGASAFAVVDEVDPNDADYLTSSTAGDLTEMDLLDLPPEITYIRGIVQLGRMSKSDSGYADIKFGMKSVAATADSTAFPITVEPTYWWVFRNIDPNSGARWTRASFNDAKFRLIRNT